MNVKERPNSCHILQTHYAEIEIISSHSPNISSGRGWRTFFHINNFQITELCSTDDITVQYSINNIQITELCSTISIIFRLKKLCSTDDKTVQYSINNIQITKLCSTISMTFRPQKCAVHYQWYLDYSAVQYNINYI